MKEMSWKIIVMFCSAHFSWKSFRIAMISTFSHSQNRVKESWKLSTMHTKLHKSSSVELNLSKSLNCERTCLPSTKLFAHRRSFKKAKSRNNSSCKSHSLSQLQIQFDLKNKKRKVHTNSITRNELRSGQVRAAFFLIE